MARDLRLSIEGDSSSANKALAQAERALEKASKEMRQAEARTDALAIKARKLAESEERAADKTRDLAAKAAVLRKQIDESGDATGTLGKKLDRLTRDTRTAALATDDYRRAADRAAAEAREQARAYDRVADHAREAARAVATLGAVSALSPNGKGGKGGLLGGLLGAGSEISQGFLKGGIGGGSAALEGVLGTPVLGPAVLALGAAASLPVATFAGSALGGGALAGLGIGAAGLGLAGAAAGDPDKYAARWESATDRIKKRWIDSSRAFGNELDMVLYTADETLRNLPVEKILALSQSLVAPIATGAGQGVTGAANGFADALERAQPVADTLGPKVAQLGNDFGDAARIISQGSEGGADALGDLVDAIGFAVKAGAVLILGFEKAYEKIRNFTLGVRDAIRASQFGPAFEGITSMLFDVGNTSIVTARQLKTAGDAAHDTAFDWGEMAEAGARAAIETLALNDALTATRNTMLGMVNANLAVAQGWLDLKEELDEGAKSLDSNTQAGLDNQKAIVQQIELIEQRRQKEIEAAKGNAEAIDAANAKYDQEIEKLRQAAYAAHLNKEQVDALITSLTGIPPDTKANVEVRGLAQSLGQGIALGNALNNIDGRYYYATVDVSYQGYNPGKSLGNLLHHARGGEMPYSGFHVVGEHGPEIRWDDRGTYTSSAEETRKLVSMMGSASTGGSNGPLPVRVVGTGAEDAVAQLIQLLVDRGLVQLFAAPGGGQVSTRRG